MRGGGRGWAGGRMGERFRKKREGEGAGEERERGALGARIGTLHGTISSGQLLIRIT